MPEHNQAAAHKSNLACGCRAAAVSLVGAVALYRPLVSGVTPAPASTSAFGLLLLTASLLWLGSELLRGQLQVRFGPAALVFSIFMAVAFASSVRAENWFAGLHWWLLLATYGLTAFLILQLADTEQERSFLMSCLLATAVALAAYGLWHYVLYMPAVRRWLAADPLLFQAVSGAVGPLADDLGARVASNRAYGSFLGPNQLANFLAISFFPLLALVIGGWLARKGEAKRSAADWIVLAIGCAGAALMLAMLYLTGSKGGWISLLVGAAILVWCSPRRLLVGAAIAAALVLVAYLATAMPKPAPLDASLGVRFGYWRTSLDIAGERPVLGVGPGSWPDWYAMLKQPEFEETQDPHCLYLQVLAETGVAGLVLCLAFWAVLLISALEHSGGRMFEILPERGERSGGTAPARGLLAGMGLGAAALALAFDYATVGTFHPPEQVPAWLGAAPWLPYVLIYAVWSGAFLAFFRGAGGGQVALSPWAMTAALSVFLVHSAVERTLSVPAIGSTVAVLAALLLATSRLPLQRKAPVQATTALLIFVAALVMVALWGVGPTRWAVQAALGRNASDNLRAEALAQDQAPSDAEAQKIGRGYRLACAALPWDSRLWRELGEWQIWRAEQGSDRLAAQNARHAVARAVNSDPLNHSNWAALGKAYTLEGEPQDAALAYAAAAALYPSLPESWYRCGRALESAGGAARHVLAAYERALSLMPRQYHDRNRVLGSPAELAAIWAEVSGQPSHQPLLNVAVGLASRAEAIEFPTGASDGEKVAQLTKGLKGGNELAEGWESHDEATRERELWRTTGGRLWQWALEVKVKLAEGSTGEARNVQPGSGASGGARTLNPGFTKAVLYR